ncbi:hypothetical protein HXX25_05115 [Hyphobacterium sp. CCMP332]|jgi:cytochrome b pre-mRNA-processing protein 3|uniref:ubiquinol-cytochrome C chaperone family protein n=1 Tax=Hyphobacterium sp. CCMP332 TaxID=2749086 RepID=UPI001650798D|nr:ubiquinol-cytochrome C chaperone family protein [Hyphobacterium sp. CCMP332]QNL18779.1 hypothetical protein HXX25_05115 [Hyphobacterium sp. CCMP332]
MLSFLKARRQSREQTQALYDRIVVTARQPQFYAVGGVPDTPEGRFELISLHVILAISRLNAEGETGRAAGQALFDHFFKDMDYAMREMGIGDTSIGKKIRAMAEVFYGRFKSYAGASDSGDRSALVEAIGRNLLGDPHHEQAGRFADYFRKSTDELATLSLLNANSADELRFADF